MNWLAIQALPLLIINLMMLAVVLAGTAVNGAMLAFTAHRTWIVHKSGEARRDPVARLEMRRAVRVESTYFAIQLTLLIIGIYSLARVVPSLPGGAVDFFFWSMAGRAVVSVFVSYLSAADLMDRRKIAFELDRLHPETPPSGVG